jgi:hypothetical protein
MSKDLKVYKIRLGKSGEFAIVNGDDYGKLMSYKWYLSGSSGNTHRYARSQDRKGERSYFMHRVILPPPPGMVIDHINGNTLDNRKENLRICTTAQNCANRHLHRTNKTGFRGVSSQGRHYRATVRKNWKTVYRGVFKTPEEAARAYDINARIHHGDFAVLNFNGLPEPPKEVDIKKYLTRKKRSDTLTPRFRFVNDYIDNRKKYPYTDRFDSFESILTLWRIDGKEIPFWGINRRAYMAFLSFLYRHYPSVIIKEL